VLVIDGHAFPEDRLRVDRGFAGRVAVQGREGGNDAFQRSGREPLGLDLPAQALVGEIGSNGGDAAVEAHRGGS
jgi:hypothetical protein